MTGSEDLDAIAARTAALRRLLLAALAAAVLALIFRGLLIAPSIGIPDVQLPGGAADQLAGKARQLGVESPHAIGSGWGLVPGLLAYVIEALTTVAMALFVYALVKRRSGLGLVTGVYVVLIQLVGPVPGLMMRAPPSAISANAAERLIGPYRAATAATPRWRRYMHAQVAYIHGDRAAAQRLSAGMEPDDSPAEGEQDYRLQFLRGETVAATNVCFRMGCLSPGHVAQARTATMAVLAVALALAAAAGWVFATMRARLQRVGMLRAKARLAGFAG